MRVRWYVGLAFALQLTGCATSPIFGPGTGSGSNAGVAAPAPAGAAGGAGAQLPPEPVLSGPSAALLDQSRDQRQDGNLGGAAATIERALTIEPDAAQLWLELAEIRWDQGELELAEEMARKTLTLTPTNSLLAERARRLLRR